MLGFTLINVSKGSPRGSKSAVYQSRSDDATTVFIASGNNPSWDVFLGLHDCSLSPTRLLTHKQLGISSQNVILFSNIISYILNISVWIRSNSVSIYWQHCGYFRTRASVGRRLSSHPCASCCLWVKTHLLLSIWEQAAYDLGINIYLQFDKSMYWPHIHVSSSNFYCWCSKIPIMSCPIEIMIYTVTHLIWSLVLKSWVINQ